MQVVNADAMVVKLNSGEYKTIHLSSIRPPRNEGEVQKNKNLSAFKCLHSFACDEELLEIEGVSECSWMSESFVVSQHLVSRYFPPKLSYLKAAQL